MLVVVVAAFVMLVVSGEIAIVPVLSADLCKYCSSKWVWWDRPQIRGDEDVEPENGNPQLQNRIEDLRMLRTEQT